MRRRFIASWLARESGMEEKKNRGKNESSILEGIPIRRAGLNLTSGAKKCSEITTPEKWRSFIERTW
jgi:hypothetical protein